MSNDAVYNLNRTTVKGITRLHVRRMQTTDQDTFSVSHRSEIKIVLPKPTVICFRQRHLT